MATLESGYLNGFAGNAQVEALQQALKALSQAANWPAVDPGTIDGVVGIKTASAVLAAVNNVKEIPQSVKTTLSIALAAALVREDSRAEAFALITRFASELTTALTAAIARYAGSGQPAGSGGPKIPIGTLPPHAATGVVKGGTSGGSFWSPPAGTPWYKQGRVYAIGAGITALGVGAFFMFRR